jgi:hypothetical protein
MVSDPEEASIPLPLSGDAYVDFHFYYSVVLPNATITGLNPFTLADYGLSARCPTLKAGCCHTSLQGLATRWLANLPGRGSHPLDYTTLPGRTKELS